MKVDVEREQAKRREKARTEPFTLRRLPRTSAQEVWEVANGSKGTAYHVTVNVDGGDVRCDCPDFTLRCSRWGIRCKHIEAVRLYYRNGGRYVPSNITVMDENGNILHGGGKMNGKNRIRFSSTMTKSAFLHVEYCPDIRKVRFYAGTYEAGEGAKVIMSHYLDEGVAFFIAHDLLNARDIDYREYKGTARNGEVVSRRFSINTKDGKVFVELEQGPGQKTETGAVVPVKGASTSTVRIVLNRNTEARKVGAEMYAFLLPRLAEPEREAYEAPETEKAGVEVETKAPEEVQKPEAGAENNGSPAPATEKQVKLVFTLLRELGYRSEERAREVLRKKGYDPDNLSKEEASELIERLKKARARNGKK